MEELTLTAYAKLNLYLDITGRREDGYHLLETVMQSVSLADHVTIKRAEGISVSCSNPLIPSGEGNICHKAARLFLEEFGGAGADIRIEKRIPSGAGMGGGSADAAAVLKGLNALYGNIADGERLHALAAEIGADVPFCLYGGTRICRGIGDIISDMPQLADCAFLVVMPDFSCSTAEAYRRYDDAPLPPKNGLEEFVASGREFWRYLYNCFETLYGDPRIADMTRRLRSAGALNASLTGSGAAVFGVFKDMESAAAAAKKFPTEFTAVSEVVARD